MKAQLVTLQKSLQVIKGFFLRTNRVMGIKTGPKLYAPDLSMQVYKMYVNSVLFEAKILFQIRITKNILAVKNFNCSTCSYVNPLPQNAAF